MKACKNKSESMIDQFCILRENTTSTRGRSGLDTRSRNNTQRPDYYIKVDTTPWIEADNWKFKTSSQTPTLKNYGPLKKKFNRLSEDMNKNMNKTMNTPIKLEEKLNFIGKKLMNLNGKLSNIERMFKDNTQKKGNNINLSNKIKAAVVIQRAFREYLRKKYKYAQRAAANQIGRYSNLRVIPFFMMQGSINSKEKIIVTKKSEKNMQTSRQGNRNVKFKSKGLIQTIIYLQSHIKGFILRKKYQKIRNSVIKIQKTFKMYQTRRIFSKIINAIIYIQKQYRKYSKIRIN